MKKNLLIVFFLFLVYFLNAQVNTGNLEIRITGVRNPKGKISINLFNKADGFPDEPMKSFGWKTVKIVPDTVLVVFESLPFGDYAVSALHDEDGDGKMNKNFLGIPKEGFAFSNNITPKFKSPEFSEAVFSLKKKSMKIDLKMLYF